MLMLLRTVRISRVLPRLSFDFPPAPNPPSPPRPPPIQKPTPPPPHAPPATRPRASRTLCHRAIASHLHTCRPRPHRIVASLPFPSLSRPHPHPRALQVHWLRLGAGHASAPVGVEGYIRARVPRGRLGGLVRASTVRCGPPAASASLPAPQATRVRSWRWPSACWAAWAWHATHTRF